jgi:uncharacterized membrane protein
MQKRLKIVLLAALLFIGSAVVFMPTQAHKDGVDYWRAEVVSTKGSEQGNREIRLLSGPQKGQTVPASVGSLVGSLDLTPPTYVVGDAVLVSAGTASDNAVNYTIIDYYRMSAAVWLFVGVLVLAVLFAGWRGLGALIGLVLSIIVLAQFIIPQILSGTAPYLVTALGIIIISLPGIYIAHGVSRRTSLALLSTYITLGIAVLLSIIAVQVTRLSGVATENIWFLSQAAPELNIRGLLICGLLISLVGILDDITVSQTAAIHELKRADPTLSTRELYTRGLRIGREHIASLINTLVLVYVGASLLFIVYLTVAFPYPLLVMLNSEMIMEEIIRALVGSGSLILAVPITTILAAKFLHDTTPTKPAPKHKKQSTEPS